MSSSVFRDIDEERYSQPDDVDEKLKLEQNLVILVNNKSGKVSVDERTLHSLLANETTNTSVSIVSVSSPTPSMNEEIDEEERQHLEMSQEELMQTLTEGDDTPVQPVIKKKTGIPRVGIIVENYYPPEEAKHFVAEVLSLAGIDNPLTIDYEFQRYVIQNDHCYTNLTLPTKTKLVATKKHKVTSVKKLVEPEEDELSPRSQRVRKPSVRLLESSETEITKEEHDDNKQEATQEEEEPLEESESEYESEESETSIEDNDNDSDLDFDINRSNRPPKKGKKKRKVPKSKAILKNIGSKISKKRQSIRSIDSEELDTSKEKGNKGSFVKKPAPEKKTPQRKVVSKGKQPPADPKEAGIEASPVISTPPVREIPSTSGHQQVVKKESKKKDHLDVLFTDMSSLFSKPDKIKKIDLKTPKKQGSNDSEQLDLIDSIVQNELEHNALIVESEMAEELPSIVKMLENPEVDLPDNALLETLGESLPEDFLHTVAELAENKEIQEIIDKQVLGVNIDQPIIPTIQPTSVTSTPIQSKNVLKVATITGISLTEARKHPLKVMRSDGRVITLPPIEVPTTRGAKKRLQSDSSETSPAPSRETSLIKPVEVTPEPVVVKAAKIKKSTSVSKDRSREQSREKSTSRRSSVKSTDDSRKDSTSSSLKRKRGTNPAVLAVLKNEKAEDSESGESWNSEDDPDRLWCICRQPHNNRFMICCDVCEDWFHGKCVNITKAQGNQMESEGKEWTCPNCIKKKQEKEQPKITSFLNESGEGSKSNKLCIVCKKEARRGSIYCSDECITKHAQDALVSTKIGSPSKKGHEVQKSSVDMDFDKQIQTSKIVKNKEDRVIVFEKATNRCLTGANAPSAQNLKQWLKEHPTFQAVTPGTVQMNAIMAKKRQLKEVASKLQTAEKDSSSKSSLFSNPSKVQTKLKFDEAQKLTISNVKETETKLPTLKSPTTSTPLSSRHNSSGKNSHEKKVVKRQSSSETPKKTTPGNSKDTRDHDIIRIKSKEGLQTALEERMNEVTGNSPRLTPDEIKEFANNVENELYLLFNKDCNQKYRVKYRSLVFNIRDRKNLTLFQKICEKNIKPYRLVRMEPQEMASQELAQWRENENKHQLDMIKKSELELLACSKNYVLKTHKGEEVVESKKVDRVELDPNMAVEDVVKVLNNSSSTMSASVVPKASSSSKGHDDNYYVKSYTHDKEKDKKHHHSSSKHSKHKRKRSRDRSESRHHSHDSKKNRRSPVEHTSNRHHDSKKDKRHEKHDRTKDREKKKPVKDLDIPTPTQEDFNLIDKILEGSQVVLQRPGTTKPGTSTNPDPDPKSQQNLTESDQEPSSTVNIQTPPRNLSPVLQKDKPIWTGKINMVDVLNCPIEMRPVAGDIQSIVAHFPKTLEIVGRITPETVWDYIDKIQKSSNKEIIIVRLSSDDINYEMLYNYYDSRRRLGVLQAVSSVIKDFYIFPLAAGRELPSVLRNIKGVGFVEGKHKPDLLVGVIVKILRDKPTGLRQKVKQQAPLLPPIITKQSLENIDPSFSLAEESSSSKPSRKSKLLSLGLPKTNSDEDDEPYSPGGSDDNDVSSSIAVTTKTTIKIKQTAVTDEEASKLDEINREIQARKMEIAGMLNVDPDSLDEPYSPSRPVSPPTHAQPSILPGLDKIAIPSNLSEILASIKSCAQPSQSDKDDANEEYDPTTTIAGLGYYQSTVTYKASGYTETTQVSVSERIAALDDENKSQESGQGEKRKLGEGDLDLRIMPNDQLPISLDEPAVNDEDCFEIPDEDGVKRARWDTDERPTTSQNKKVTEATGDLDLRMLSK